MPRALGDEQKARQGSQGQRQGQQQTQQGQGSNLNRLLEDFVLVRLSDEAWVGGDFKVTAEQGTVTVAGTVPSERAKARMLRIARETVGITEVRDQLRVQPASATAGSNVDDRELSRRVAQQIAATIPGVKAGEDWWLTGWRVEGEDNLWSFIVEADNGQVYLEGDVPRLEIMRKAVDAARNVAGVVSVRSDFELDRMHARYPYIGYPYGWGYPYVAYPYGYGRPDLSVHGIDVVRPGAHAMSTVSGTVTSIDQQRNTVTLRTVTGSMNLKLSPSALQNLEQGEQVTLEIGVRQSTPAASPTMDAARQHKMNRSRQDKTDER